MIAKLCTFTYTTKARKLFKKVIEGTHLLLNVEQENSTNKKLKLTSVIK